MKEAVAQTEMRSMYVDRHGKLVFIGDEQHEFQLPAVPDKPLKIVGDSGYEHTIPLNELIIGRGLDYENAFWKREDLPWFFYEYIPDHTKLFQPETIRDGDEGLVALSELDSTTLIYLFDREMFRRRYGVHFKCGNDIEYLTGHHYGFLQWIKPYGLNAKLLPPWRPKDYEYAEYREFQRDIFYLIDKCNDDPDILGLYIAKPKKTGVTQIFSAYYLNKGTMTRMAQMGIMSKGSDASTVNMLMVIHGYDGLPPIFQPNLKNRADKEGDLFFGEPALRNVKTKAGKLRRQKLMDAKPLNTRVWAAKTKAAGFDSPTMTDIWFDELPKYDTENKQEPETVFNRNQETVKIQDIYNGRIWITSYPPETDSLGFYQGRKIFYGSLKETVKEGDKRTRTGLIAHYVSSILSYTSTFNKYGKCDQNEAHRRNHVERDKVKGDKKAYQGKIRQYSETMRECWASGGSGSVFDNVRLGELKYDLDMEMKANPRFFVDGRLEWKNSLWEAGAKNRRPLGSFCEVLFIPLTEQEIERGDAGRLRQYRRLAPGKLNMPLRMGYSFFEDRAKGIRMKLLNPLPVFENYGAFDPTDYAANSDVIQGSKNAGYTMNLPNILENNRGRVDSNIILSEYFDRPDNPQEVYEDVVKEIIYYGKKVIVEANKAWLATRLIQDGLGYYMVVRNKATGNLETWQPGMDYSLFRTGTEELETIVRVISIYITKPRNENEIDYGRLIKTERLLQQLQDFSKERSNFFDLVMAFGICLICGEVIMSQPVATTQGYDHDLVAAIWDAISSN